MGVQCCIPFVDLFQFIPESKSDRCFFCSLESLPASSSGCCQHSVKDLMTGKSLYTPVRYNVFVSKPLIFALSSLNGCNLEADIFLPLIHIRKVGFVFHFVKLGFSCKSLMSSLALCCSIQYNTIQYFPCLYLM